MGLTGANWVWTPISLTTQLFSPVYNCFHLRKTVSTCFNLLSPVYVCFHLFTSVYTCFHLFLPVYTCLHLFSPVYTCLHLFSPVWTWHLFAPVSISKHLIFVVRYAAAEPRAEGIWTPLGLPEIHAFLAIFILMGVKVLPEIDSYWSSSPLIGCSWIKSTMPRNRFKTINRFLHLADNAFLRRRGDPNYDPIFKVRPIVEHMKTRFRQ